MLINPSKTVGQIAVELPQSARVFERMKIDYCCGGERALSEACAAAGVETRRVITLLEESAALAAPPKIDLRESRLADLIVYILDTHHVFTREQMARLEQLAGKVIAAHGINHPELATVEALMRSLFAELEPHMRKEEQILFPFIVRLDQARRSHTSQPAAHFGTINNPIRMMMLDNDAEGEVL